MNQGTDLESLRPSYSQTSKEKRMSCTFRGRRDLKIVVYFHGDGRGGGGGGGYWGYRRYVFVKILKKCTYYLQIQR